MVNAIVLAGGVGTRLRPLSCTRPKLLFPLLNKPLLDWTLERLHETGVKGVTLAVKYMAEAFMRRYGEATHGLKISYSKEKVPMGTGGAIKYAEPLIGHKEPFLVLNGDIFTTIDFRSLLRRHRETGAAATIAVYAVDDPSRYGTVKLTKENRITQFTEKVPKELAPSNLINAGIYVLEPEVFSYIPAGRPVSIEREVFPKLADEGKLYAYILKEIWVDIGKPEDYLRANRLLLERQSEKRLIGEGVELADGVELAEPIMIDGKVAVGEQTKLGPYTIIGEDVTLGKNVQIEDSVVFPGAAIMDNATVRGAIIGECATVGVGAKIMDGAMIGDNATIRDGVTVSKGATVCHSKEVNDDVPESTRIL